jgi:polyisoprenoid-binding protein YceI
MASSVMEEFSMFSRTVAPVLFLMLCGDGAIAAPSLDEAAGRYSIAPGGSAIAFTVDRVGGGGLKGRFARFSGEIDIDGRDIRRSHVDFVIFPESVTTGTDRVDRFLRSDAIFDAAHATKIAFRSTRIDRLGDTSATVSGLLTARGKSRTETFTVELTKFNRTAISFHVQGKVLRSPYGMDSGAPIYSNVVKFDMTLTGRRR